MLLNKKNFLRISLLPILILLSIFCYGMISFNGANIKSHFLLMSESNNKNIIYTVEQILKETDNKKDIENKIFPLLKNNKSILDFNVYKSGVEIIEYNKENNNLNLNDTQFKKEYPSNESILAQNNKGFSVLQTRIKTNSDFNIDLTYNISDELEEANNILLMLSIFITAIFVIIYGCLSFIILFFNKIIISKNNTIEEKINEMEVLNYSLDEKVKEKTIELINMKERFEYFAYHDSLTDLYNRLFFVEFINKNEGVIRNAAMILVDLDNFKKINEALGHILGDEILKSVGNRIEAIIPDNSVLARLAGDEFVIFLRDEPDKDETLLIINSLMSAFKAPFEALETSVNITISIGAALFPRDAEDFNELLRNTDIALYNAKSKGRDTYSFFDKSMLSVAQNKIIMEKKLRHAIFEDKIDIYYQPLLDKNGKLLGAEALSRWFDEETNSFINPGIFIPLAEESGLIIPLGYCIINKICNQMQIWKEKDFHVPNISFNVSIKQLLNFDFVNILKDTIKLYELSTHEFTIEITESCFANKELTKILQDIYGLGFGVAIDDFGTGYSSLSYLKRLPVSKLKIDKSFVDDCTNNNDDRVVIETIIKLAKQFDLKINAEGVETEEQAKLLSELGVNELQGFYFSRPLPLLDFERKYNGVK